MAALFKKTISIRWSDIDPNFHLRHSAYYDFGAQHRMELLESLGLTLNVMQEQSFGPVLFREECVFRREIKFSDKIDIHTKLISMKPDASRWTLAHEFYKEEDVLCATLTLDGAWMDTTLRKLVNPVPKIAVDTMLQFPKST